MENYQETASPDEKAIEAENRFTWKYQLKKTCM
jgi:hypothetical protein